jgi:hypothetical protein
MDGTQEWAEEIEVGGMGRGLPLSRSCAAVVVLRDIVVLLVSEQPAAVSSEMVSP